MTATRWLSLAAVLCLGLSAGGCKSRQAAARRVERAFYFERGCTDALCGFELRAGQARLATAFSPGEHVLELDAGAVVERGISLRVPSTQEGVGLLARCDDGARLRVEQEVYAWERGADGGFAPHVSTQSAPVPATPEWDLFDLEFAPRPDEHFTQRVTLRLAVEGAGRCAVDTVEYGAIEPSAATLPTTTR